MIVNFYKKLMLCSFAIITTEATTAYAADMFGNPTVIGIPGQVEISIGGGKSANLALDVGKSIGTLQDW